MNKTISSIAVILGIILLIGCPLYQEIDQVIQNTEGDGINKYGDNPVFRNVLGVKNIHSDFLPGTGWCETDEIDLVSAPWMQKLFGVSVRVSSESTKEDIMIVYLCRLSIKLIPLLLIIIGILIKKKKAS